MSSPQPKTFRPRVAGSRKRRVPGHGARGAGQRPRRRPLLRWLWRLLWWIIRPRRFTYGLAGLAIAALIYGTPHLLITYRCAGVGEPHVFCWECNYYGLRGWVGFTPGPGECPMLRWYPVRF